MKMKVLLAMDSSKNSLKAARYAADLLGNNSSDVSITLFHVLNTVPPAFLETGTFEQKPDQDRDRADWEKSEHATECKCMELVTEMLKKVGFDDSRIEEKHFAPRPEFDVANVILEECEKGDYDTIIMGKRGHSPHSKFLAGSVTEKIVRHAKGKAVWVIE